MERLSTIIAVHLKGPLNTLTACSCASTLTKCLNILCSTAKGICDCTAKDMANSTELVIDGEHILVSGLSSVGHCLYQLVGAPVDGQCLSIPHPGDSSGRGISGNAS